MLGAPLLGAIWSANIFGMLGVKNLLRKDYLTAQKRSMLAAALSVCSLLVSEIPRNENGGIDKVTLGPSAFLWITSMVALLIGSYFALRMSEKPSLEPNNMSAELLATHKKRTLPALTLAFTIILVVLFFIVVGIADTLANSH